MTEPRPLYEIANEIRRDWGPKMSPHAKPYVDAMAQVTNIQDMYYLDDARGIVRYFLSNAATWRGETAKRVKLELKEMLKG